MNRFDVRGRIESKIVDSHVHVGRWGKQIVSGKTIDPFGGRELDSFKKVSSFIKKHRVERIVLTPIYSPDPSTAFKLNPVVLQYAKKEREKIIPGLWVDPSPEVRQLLKDTIDLAKREGVSVLKTSPDAWSGSYSADPSTWSRDFSSGIEAVLSFLREIRGVFQIHTGSGKSDIRSLERFIRFAGPGVTLHLVHMGKSVHGNFYLLPRITEWTSEGLDIICDTSLAAGFALRWAFAEAQTKPELVNRILFGSDEPWGIFESELSKVLYAAEDVGLIKKVLWENANRVYFLLDD